MLSFENLILNLPYLIDLIYVAYWRRIYKWVFNILVYVSLKLSLWYKGLLKAWIAKSNWCWMAVSIL